jgi:rhodanese-related sulfurtransferase
MHHIPEVDVQEASRRIETAREDPGAAQPLLVDVREVNEFIDVRAVGAVLVPLSGFMERYEALPKDRPLLMICRTGARSGNATQFLLANGWTDVVNVAGGTMAWQQAELPTRNGPIAPGEQQIPR